MYLFADDTITYIEDLKASIKQVSELISEFSIVRKMRLVYKNQMHFYMLSLNNLKTEINLTNYLQNIHSSNYKASRQLSQYVIMIMVDEPT